MLRAADGLGVRAWVNARTDVYLLGAGALETRLESTMERARVYADAGAIGFLAGPNLTGGRGGVAPQRTDADWTFPISVLDATLLGLAPSRGVGDRGLPALEVPVGRAAGAAGEPEGCEADVSYMHTSLGPEGDDFVRGFTEASYVRAMQQWEARMNHYLVHDSAFLDGTP